MHKLSDVLRVLGFLLLAAALVLTFYNICDDNRAKATSQEIVEILQEDHVPVEKQESTGKVDPVCVTEPQKQIPNYILNPEMAMPVKTVNGQEYVGMLSILELSLQLPVINNWDYPKLKEAPCLYTGSAYQDNLVIMAHNYQSHFGKINTLSIGSRLTFMDMDGNVFQYQVVATELMNPTSVDEVVNSQWDLTLFTCTIGGKSRIAVRCERV